MENTETQITVNRRNSATVEQELRKMNSTIFEQQKRIDSLNSALSSMTERLNVLERMLIIQKVTSFGTGPSVK